MEQIEELTEIFKALADGTRIKLLKMLMEQAPGLVPLECGMKHCGGGPLCVNALAARLGITQSAVSQHLRVLRQAGLVRGERNGAFVHYSVNENFPAKFRETLKEVLGEGLAGE